MEAMVVSSQLFNLAQVIVTTTVFDVDSANTLTATASASKC